MEPTTGCLMMTYGTISAFRSRSKLWALAPEVSAVVVPVLRRTLLLVAGAVGVAVRIGRVGRWLRRLDAVALLGPVVAGTTRVAVAAGLLLGVRLCGRL